MNSIKGYRLLERIGTGAAGPVDHAKTDAGDVAIRQFESTAEPASQAWLDERHWFLQAGRQSLGLTHPRIVPVLDVIDEAGTAGIVMEYMASPTLATALLATRRFTPAETDAVLRQVAMALDFAHGRGVVHGDLKPSDIFLTEKGARVSDFAISPRARRLERGAVPARLVHGYLSPEHLRASATIGPRSDQYSLAVIAYQMFTGQSPYGNNVLDLAPAILSAPIAPPSQVDGTLPSGIDGPLLKALNRDPDQRYGSCGELFAFLGASLIAQPEPANRRIPVWAYVLSPLLLLLLIAGVWLLTRKPTVPKGDGHPVVVQNPTPPTSTAATQRGKSRKKTAKSTAAVEDPPPPEVSPQSVPSPVARPAVRPPEEPPAVLPTAPGFTIDVLSRTHPIKDNSSFPLNDRQLGNLSRDDLSVLIGFEGQHLPKGPMTLVWTLDGKPMASQSVALSRSNPTSTVVYQNEPSDGKYEVQLKVKGKVVKSFNFEITK